MIDQALAKQYAAAVHSRGIIKLLPSGLREHAQLFEQMCLQDIRAQTGNPSLFEQDILAEVRPLLMELLKQVLPILAQIIIAFINKKWPTATATGIVSAVLTYLAGKWG